MDDPSRPSRRSSTPASSDVDQEHEQAERLALIGSEDRPRRRRKRKIAVGVVLVGFVLLAMAPTIGGRVGKGWVERSASQALGAGVRVERLGLSWFGPQRLEGVQIVDEALRQVADVDVSMDRSLLALARNRMDLGTIRLSGELSIDQRASRTELQRDGAIESGSPTDVDRSVVFPRGLSARLELDGLDIVYRYRNQSEYSISDLTGSVSFGVGRTCEADLSAVISSDESRASATIAASVAGLTSSAGAFTPDRAMLTGSITVEGSGIPISGSLGRALRAGGDEDGAFSAALELSGTLSHGSVGLDLSAAGGRASLPMVYDRGPDAYVLSPEQDCTATLTASAVAELWPRLRRLAGASIEIGPDRLFSFDTVPACSVAIDSAHIEVPMSGGPLDLGQWILVATAELDAMSGRLDAEPWAVEPTTLTVSAFGSENAVRVQGVTTAQLGSQPAGEFVLNVSAEDLLDDRGSLRTTGEAGDWSALLGTLTGGFECNDVQSSLLDPFLRPYLDRAGVSLPDDVGERFDIELAFEDVQKRTAYLWLTSDNLSARAGVLLEDGTLRTDSAGVRVSMDSTSGILSRLLGPEGITVGSGGAVDLNIRQGSVDLDKIAAGRPGSDLTAYSGLIDLDISPMSGEVVLDGVEHTFETSPASLTLDARDLVQGAGVAASASLLVDGVDAGTLSISIDAEEIIDERGARRQGWPRIEGELSLHDAMVELAQPLADHTGLILKQDVGEHLTAIIQATADPDQHIQITGTLNSEHIDADAKLAIRDRVLYTSGSGVSVGIDRIGGWLNRVMPEGFGVEPAGKVVVSIPDAVVAIRDGRVDLSRSSLRAATEISGLELFADSDERLTIERLGADLNIPGIGEPEIGFTGTLTSKGEPVLLAGRFSADSLIRDGRLTPGSMVLDGQMDLTGWPVAGEESPVELVAEADAGDLRALAAQLFGHVLDLSIRADGDTGEIVAGVRGQRLIGSSRFRLWDGSLEHIGGKYSARIDPDVIEQIRLQRGQRAGVAGPIGPRFASPAEMEVALGACEIMQGWKPRLSGEPNVRVSLTGSVTEIALMRSGETVRSGQIGLDGLVIEGRLPLGAIASDQAGSALFAISGSVTGDQGTIAELSGDLAADFASGALNGQFDTNLKIASVDCGQIDDIARLDGLAAAAAGSRIDLKVSAHGEAIAGRLNAMDTLVELSSPRLSTEHPLRLSVLTDRITLDEPAMLRWEIAPELATRFGLGQPVGRERVRITEPIKAGLKVETFSASRAPGPFRPGIFKIQASLTAPSASLLIADEENQTNGHRSTYGPISAELSGQNGTLRLRADVPSVQSQDSGFRVDAELSDFANHDGEFDIEQARIEGRLVASALPSPLVDAVLGQQGLLAEVLGPEMSVDIQTRDVTADSGEIAVVLDASRASGSLEGTMADGRFVAMTPGEIVITEVRPELGGYVGRAIPVIGTVTKAEDDGPARIEINRFEIPLILESDQTRAQGIVTDLDIDIGTARFRSSSLFSSVLRAVGQRTESQVGRRIDPIHTRIASGVLTYDRATIPLGEFTLESEGSYRLSDGYIDVVTYIPFAALTDQAAGDLNTGLGSLLGRTIPGLEQATMVPWRTRGTPGALKSEPDLELLAKGIVDTLDPTDLINQGLGSLQDLLLEGDK